MNPNRGFYFILLLLIFWSPFVFAQGWKAEANSFEKNWNFTLQVGRTAMLSEINKDFSGTSNDMNNQSDWGFNLQLAKMIWEQLDMGFEFGISNYKGYKNYSSNVNWLNLHSTFNNEKMSFQPFPIYYDSDVTNFSLYAKYNFANFSTLTHGYLKLNLYTKVAVGLLFPSVELGFKDDASYVLTGLTKPLYLKGRYPYPSKDSHFILNPALGLNYQLNDRIFFSAETSFQLIGADNLDGIHNFNTLLTPDIPYLETKPFRIPVYDLTAKFMVGLTYYFNIDTHKEMREKVFPWFRNNPTFYSSKFHTTSIKKNTKKTKSKKR